ncbi:SusF/SusE family outer membrane protein [Maribacter luteus]|uniref:SusF/SusE family outer membrane protein n=1 Tax=Maribacter luteus TaxID=2594478 RepID=UPI0024922B9B|nr:SusF/SusE family outer membrane protein [Maribacter luteus]
MTILFIACVGIVFNACDDDDNITYIAEATGDFEFSNSFLSEYVLTATTSNNIGERFTWEDADFGIQTTITYELQKSILGDDTDVEVVGSTTSNELSLTIGNLLTYAAELGIDNDPETEAINTGTLYFRVRAYVGDDSTTELFTPFQSLTVVLPEETGTGSSGIEISEWGIVGSATPNAWDGPDVPFYTTSENNIIVAYASLIDGQIKFRQNNSWDDPNINYGDLTGDGILDTENENNIDVTAGTYKITINLNDNSYSIEEYSWGLVGSATPNAWEGPDVKLSYDYATDTWKTVIQLVDGEIKFRQNNSWDDPNINYGDLTGDGILDTENENNIAVTAGYYLVTVNFNTLEYSIEETEIWGVVGSAAPNGWDGPDVKLVPDFSNPGVWNLNDITLLDGDIKFRINDDWGGDYGDLDDDGVLDQESDNNIAVAAGSYDITINFNDLTYTITAN